VLDVRMPGETGLELQATLLASGRDVPIVFITGHDDIPMAVRAMKAGAVDFLAKPFEENDLLVAVAQAVSRSRPASSAS
jgi:FixJ family two-component response regulator